jgi:hypothetical protein
VLAPAAGAARGWPACRLYASERRPCAHRRRSGTERVVDGAPVATVLVINSDGTREGFQDKVQLDPSVLVADIDLGTATGELARRYEPVP